MGRLVKTKEIQKVEKEFENTENITLYNADCLDVFKDLPPESVDLVVTDCPYHIIGGGCTNAEEKGWYSIPKGILDRGYEGNLKYTKEGKLFKYNEIKFSEWIPKVYRVLKPNTHCYIMINGRNLMELQQECEKVGFAFQNLLVWDKGNVTPNKYYMNAYELILMLRKGAAKNINNIGTSNILKVPNITHIKEHPTEKPWRLMKILIENSSDAGDVVLDPFMGVGSTGIACRKCSRRFIGIEIDENYFEIAQKRISEV